MPAVPVSLIEPIWAEFAMLLPDRPAMDPTHPLGCHRRRVPDRVVFDHVVDAMVHGSGYERIASPGCSDRTIRRRMHEWAAAGLTQQLHALVLAQYDRMIGLELDDVAVDGCITKAPSGGETAGRSPVDRGKQGLKRSTLTDATGVPLHLVATGANRHDGPLLGPTLTGLERWGAAPSDTTVHLDRGYESGVTRALLADLGFTGAIARKGLPAPLQVGKRWVVERTQAWMNGYGKLRRCTEKTTEVVDFYLFLAAAFVVTRCLIQRARIRYRWPGRPTTRRLK
ncbi:MAG: Putative transposase [uncultured Chloroflexia bacterium]|uniref:Transposase n=1 Tax=uncultured Chloroflexia bacterium TaxID=1672391 RepID=A0A6J4IFH0_9CHLR|nr:MAG: Putative transposase [uncultured Chloroflexia bacterium]